MLEWGCVICVAGDVICAGISTTRGSNMFGFCRIDPRTPNADRPSENWSKADLLLNTT